MAKIESGKMGKKYQQREDEQMFELFEYKRKNKTRQSPQTHLL
jgi:hypothetical protein